MTSLRIMAFMTLVAGLLAVCEGFGKGEDSTDATAARRISELEDQIVELEKQVKAAEPAKISDSEKQVAAASKKEAAACVDACTILLLNFRSIERYSSPPKASFVAARENGQSAGISTQELERRTRGGYNKLYEAYPEAAAENWAHLYPFSCRIACHAKTCPARTRCRELGNAVHETYTDEAFEAWEGEYPAAAAALDEGMAFGCLGLCDDDGEDTVLMMYYTHFKGRWDGADEPLHLSKDVWTDENGKHEEELDLFENNFFNDELTGGGKFLNRYRAWEQAYEDYIYFVKDTTYEA